MLRQGFVNCRPGHTERIGWAFTFPGALLARPAREISDELCRCIPVGTAQAIGGRLAGTLESRCRRSGSSLGRSSGVTLTSRAAFALRPSRGIETGPVDAQMARF